MTRLALVLSAVLLLLSGCAAPAARIGSPGEIPLYVVAHGWHTGVAMRARDIDFARWHPLPHPAHARYIEVGWGDRDYYPAPGFNLWYAIKAVGWPTPSVLHVVGFDAPPAIRFPESQVIELGVSQEALERLLEHVVASFAPDPVPIAPGLYATGAFYPSREHFHLFHSCNVWVAQALRAAQVEVRPSLTARGLMARLRALP